MSAWCNWHNNDAETSLPIRRIPGIGYLLHACATCRERYGLTPMGREPTSEKPDVTADPPQ